MTKPGVNEAADRAGMPATQWYASLQDAVLSVGPDDRSQVSLRRFTGTSQRMLQPPLLDTILCLHLGGPKRVQRWCEGRMTVHEVPAGALTLMPAMQSNSWLTHGPVDFAHVAFGREALAAVAVEEFDRDPDAVRLRDPVGFRSPDVEWLVQALFASVSKSGAVSGRLYPESLLVVLMVTLMRDHAVGSGSVAATAAASHKGGLPDWRLRRVVDYMTDRLGADIGLGDLTSVAGLSRAQFFRAFKQSTGLTPHRYLAALRMDRAKALLRETSLGLAEIAAAVGLEPETRFIANFRKAFGVSPARYRQIVR